MKELLKKSGIYQIRNTVNGKIYVGSAKILKRRWSTHRECLSKGKHHSRHLQSAWDKHGADVFIFEPLITCNPSMLLHYEQQFIDQLKPAYNICRTAGSSLGVVCSAATKAKISARNKGRVLTPEHREAIRKGGLGKVHSAEAKSNMSASQKLRTRSAEERAGAAERARARNIDPNYIEMMATHKRGKPVLKTQEAEDRRVVGIRLYNQTRPITESLRKNMSEGQKIAKHVERFTYKGSECTVLQLSELSGVADRHSIRKRLNAGWDVDRAVTTPSRTYKGSM